MGDKGNIINWSEKDYTLNDLAEKLKLENCLVKSTDRICSELDYFEVLCFKHIYCVRAFKVSTPADRDTKDDSKNNNNSGGQHTTLTSGEEVFIPLHYAGRGTIVPLYGDSHVCKTVEELIMTFPRYVLIEEDLKILSDSKMVHLQAGSELELLRSTKDKHYQNRLICRYGAQTLQLSPSDIGRFKVRPDPNHYSVKDILQRLKLPQIIDFEEMVTDQWEKEVNFFEGLAPDQNYMGKFLLTGLFKDKVAVVVTLGSDGRQSSQPFLLPLSSDLLQQLTFRFAFRGDFSEISFKDNGKSQTTELENQKTKANRKKEAKLKRGKSEAVENGFSDPEDDQQDVFSGDEDLTQGSQQIPFELTYTQYRFPQAEKRGSSQGDNNIFKKFSSAVKTVTGKFKKASSKDVAAIRNGVLKVSTPEPIQKASSKIYPILANLMNEDSSIYDYIESGTLGRKSGTLGRKSGTLEKRTSMGTLGRKSETLGRKNGRSQSQFYFEIEAPKIASAPSEECLNDDSPVEEEDEEEIYHVLEQVRREELEQVRTEELDNENDEDVYAEMIREPVENETQATTRAETPTETEPYEPEIPEEDYEVEQNEPEAEDIESGFYAKDDGNETERDIGSLAESEENEYMNYNRMATLQIRRRSTPSEGKRTPLCVYENFSPMRDSNYNIELSNHPQGSADEKSDMSTSEERSRSESGCSSLNTDLDDYELEVTRVIPERMTPVPAKRNSSISTGSAGYAEVADSSCSDRSSDAGCCDVNSGASSREDTTTPLESMSVLQLCENLRQCGLTRMSIMCQEHSLDGAFICALPNDSLQEEPFALSHLEVMKLSMMKKGWKPKMK